MTAVWCGTKLLLFYLYTYSCHITFGKCPFVKYRHKKSDIMHHTISYIHGDFNWLYKYYAIILANIHSIKTQGYTISILLTYHPSKYSFVGIRRSTWQFRSIKYTFHWFCNFHKSKSILRKRSPLNIVRYRQVECDMLTNNHYGTIISVFCRLNQVAESRYTTMFPGRKSSDIVWNRMLGCRYRSLQYSWDYKHHCVALMINGYSSSSGAFRIALRNIPMLTSCIYLKQRIEWCIQT